MQRQMNAQHEVHAAVNTIHSLESHFTLNKRHSLRFLKLIASVPHNENLSRNRIHASLTCSTFFVPRDARNPR